MVTKYLNLWSERNLTSQPPDIYSLCKLTQLLAVSKNQPQAPIWALSQLSSSQWPQDDNLFWQVCNLGPRVWTVKFHHPANYRDSRIDIRRRSSKMNHLHLLNLQLRQLSWHLNHRCSVMRLPMVRALPENQPHGQGSPKSSAFSPRFRHSWARLAFVAMMTKRWNMTRMPSMYSLSKSRIY